jgi:hypothetical protein
MRRSLSTRTAGILIALLAAVTVVSAADPALAGGPAYGTTTPGPTFLALGDSVPFGFRLYAPAYSDPRAFVGYPEILAADLHLTLLNASCPGETTSSFIDAGAQSNGCENAVGLPIGYRDTFPLHVAYAGSQLQYAVDTLQADKGIQLVTLQLGANDVLLCQQVPQPYCGGGTDLTGITGHVAADLDLILSRLRTDGHYTGRIAVVTYYAVDYSALTGAAGLLAVQALNSAIAGAARAHGAVVADGFEAFRSKALQAGGSSILAGLVLPFDSHPTRLGQTLLAQAVQQAVGR